MKILWKLEIGNWKFQKQGITLLLVVVIASALFSISIGIFNVVFGELRISGEIADSFIAFYAADQGIERLLYRDRVQDAVCPLGIDCTILAVPITITYPEYVSCYIIRFSRASGDTKIVASGQYRCGPNPPRVVKRGFMVTY